MTVAGDFKHPPTPPNPTLPGDAGLGILGHVHDHGSEDGPGLACPERTTPAGLRGACVTPSRYM